MKKITGDLTVTENDATLLVDGNSYILVPAQGSNPCGASTQYNDDDVAAGVARFKGQDGSITVNGCYTTITDDKLGAIAYDTTN